MILYHPTKFYFNTINSFKVMGRGHFPPLSPPPPSPSLRAQAPKKTCTLCNKLYIGESGRKLGDRFREHLLDVKNKGSDLSKPVARHFNFLGHSHEHIEICGIYLHLGNNETRKRKEQRLIFKLGTLAPNGINERFSFA